MVDRQSKDFYQQQLAQAAWANFRGASGYNPATAHSGFAGPGGGGAMGGHPAPAPTNPYENYMQQLQQFAGLSGSQTNPAMFGGSNFLGNGAKEMSPGFSSPFGFPPGHPMHFPGISNYRPLPAHSPLPAHVKNSSGPATPLPAHMRSSPYQQSNYHTPPYSYNMGQGVAGYGHPTAPPHPAPDQRQAQYSDQTQAAAAAASAAQFSKSAPPSRSSSQDPASRRQSGLPNGSGVSGVPPHPGLLPPSDVSSAYTQLQQLTAAYSQAATASAKDAGKKAAPPTTNNNYPYPYPPSTITTSSGSAPTSYSNSSMGTADQSYDQIAAALLNRFGGQFSPQLLMEMSNMSKTGQQGQGPYQQMPGFPPGSLAQAKEQAKQPPSKPHPQAVHKPPQPEAKTDTVKADRRPPDPGPGPGSQNGPTAGKQPTPQGYILPNIPRPTSSQLYPAQYSPEPGQTTQSGPPSAGLNSSGQSTDSHLSICSPPAVRGQDGLPGGQAGAGSGGLPALPGGQPCATTAPFLPSSSISQHSPAISSPASSQTLSPGQPPGPNSPGYGQHQASQPNPYQSPPSSHIVPPASPHPPSPSPNPSPTPQYPEPSTTHTVVEKSRSPSPPPPQTDPTPTPSADNQPTQGQDSSPPEPALSSISTTPNTNSIQSNHKPLTPKPTSLPLTHSVASQLPSPAPSFGLAGLASMTSKIKDLQSRQGAAKPAGMSSKAAEDRSELKGLWKMQAEFQKKNLKTKASSNNSPSPLASPAPSKAALSRSAQSTPPPPTTTTAPAPAPLLNKALQSPTPPRQPPVPPPAVSAPPPVHNPALQTFSPKPPPSHYTPLTVPTPPNSSASYNLPYANSKPCPTHPLQPPHTNLMQVPQSVPGAPHYQPPYHGGPPLLHTPRSPPHPPPPRPAQQPYSHLPPSGPHSLPSGHDHPHSYNPSGLQPPASFPSSQHYFPPSHPQQSPYHHPPYLPPASSHPVKSFQPISPPEQPKLSKSQDPPVSSHPNQNDRMEIKNSGIPGPSAITWKRKSVEDSPTSISKAKKRKIVTSQGAGDDPFAFDEEEKPGGGHHQAAKGGDQPNGGGAGPVYKYKSALLSREVEPENLSPPVVEQDRQDIGESDESSRSSGGNVSPVKKKNKRPKLEEWSVNKDAKISNKETPGKPEKAGERSEKYDGDGAGGDKSNSGVRKGPLWGLPIVPKPPVKAVEKPRDKPKVAAAVPEPVAEVPTSQGGSKVSVNNVWLQAFGAGGGKPKKKAVSEPIAVPRNGAKKSVKAEKVEREAAPKPFSILDIPPEVRRKARPVFGGLIHFTPDWARAVRRHHERCRVPPAIENSGVLKPKILAGQQTPKKSYEDFARKDMVSPPDLMAIERERVERNAAAHTTLPDPVAAITEDELPGQLPSIVETILENRKKLREAAKMGRMYKIPFMKEKKKRMMRQPVTDASQDTSGILGLLPTPGLPLLTEDTKEVLIGSGFGNYRRYTLLKYLDSLNESAGDQKAKWSPDVLDIKPRRQSSLTKSVTSLKEIFGLDAPPKKLKKVVERVSTPVDTPARASTPVSVKKEKKKKISVASRVASPSPALTEKKFGPKERQGPSQLAEESDDGAYSQEVGDPTEEDNNLQTELGGFALDLLEDNPSWSKQVTIQNLVIWEPAEQPEVIKKKKGKKKRTKKSGLDFSSHKRKSKSANISRAGSPSGEEVHNIEYTLDNVVAESSRWVIDKNAGETILHRASKMGYPDVVAYALDMMEMGPMDKDYAGLTPLHKAAFKGHETIVKVLLSYGADASAGVKGTRALHEAIEGASPSTARTLLSYGADPLLHDYSGNMPLDLSTNDPSMQLYITNLLADLHGKTPALSMRSSVTCPPPVRWNVSHYPEFHQPDPKMPSLEQEQEAAVKSRSNVEDMFSFEVTSHPLPPTYKFRDRPCDWVLYRDLKDYTKKYCQGKVDIRTKGDLLELKKSEFLKHSHCSLLDRRAVEVRFHAREQEDIVILVKVDKFVRKIFNSEVIHVAK